VYNELRSIYSYLNKLSKNKAERWAEFRLDSGGKANVNALIGGAALKALAKEYIEARLMVKRLRDLRDKITKKQAIIKTEREFVGLVKDMAKNKHLITVVKSERRFVSTYNKLVEIFKLFEKQLKKEIDLDKEIREMEQNFVKMVGDMPRKAPEIATDISMKGIYGGIMDLMDQYGNKRELSMKRGQGGSLGG